MYLMLQSIETTAPRMKQFYSVTFVNYSTHGGKYVGTIPALMAPVCTIFWRK